VQEEGLKVLREAESLEVMKDQVGLGKEPELFLRSGCPMLMALASLEGAVTG